MELNAALELARTVLQTGERVELECPLPDWFQGVLDKLERMSR